MSKKDQFVIAYLPCEKVVDCVVAHTVQLAKMLKKDIILLHIADRRYRDTSIDAALLERLQNEINSRPEGSPHASYCVLQQPTRKAVAALGELLNCVAIVAAVDPNAHKRTATHSKEMLRNFSECKTAYLTVQCDSSAALRPHYDRVAFSVDYSKESKEKLIWASYFARFNNSQLELFHHTYNDEGLRQKWHNNMRFLDKFFYGFGIHYQAHPITGKQGLFAETAVVTEAAKDGCHLLISTTTDLRNKDLLDYLLGSAEQRTIRNTQQLPILFLNPRDDLYVLCD